MLAEFQDAHEMSASIMDSLPIPAFYYLIGWSVFFYQLDSVGALDPSSKHHSLHRLLEFGLQGMAAATNDLDVFCCVVASECNGDGVVDCQLPSALTPSASLCLLATVGVAVAYSFSGWP
jgi:hypothetical protein|tara:strand:- start:1228 stop:1587 length:360 start_codon:yes stop_codon:yes gene_type:complete